MRTIGRCWYVSRRPLPLLGAALLPRAEEVPHVVGEDTLVDQHVALRRRALVVDGERAPLARVRAVVDQRDERRRDLLADSIREHRPVLLHEVGLEPVPASLVEQHAARAALQHHRQLAARRGTGAQHGERAIGRDARDLLGVDLVEVLEADAAPGASMPVCMPVSAIATQLT